MPSASARSERQARPARARLDAQVVGRRAGGRSHFHQQLVAAEDEPMGIAFGFRRNEVDVIVRAGERHRHDGRQFNACFTTWIGQRGIGYNSPLVSRRFLPECHGFPGRVSACPDRRVRPDLANAIRFLSMDAVQAANSGHPGMPMGMAEIAVALWTPPPAPQPGQPALGEPRPLRALQRPRLDAAVRAAAPHRLRPADGGAEALPPAAFEDAGPSGSRHHARRRNDHRPAGPGHRQRRRHGARRKAAGRRIQPARASTSSTTTPTSSSATAA